MRHGANTKQSASGLPPQTKQPTTTWLRPDATAQAVRERGIVVGVLLRHRAEAARGHEVGHGQAGNDGLGVWGWPRVPTIVIALVLVMLPVLLTAYGSGKSG
jgi:hypothetical protein